DGRRAPRPHAERFACRRAAQRARVPGAATRDAGERRHGGAALMAIFHPSFEGAGAHPGQAKHWTHAADTSLQEIACFGAAPEEAWEDFERWFELLDSIDDVVVVLAFFDSALKGYEEFESGWANVVYLYDLPPAQLVTATFDGRAAEECETGWSNVPYAREWA